MKNSKSLSGGNKFFLSGRKMIPSDKFQNVNQSQIGRNCVRFTPAQKNFRNRNIPFAKSLAYLISFLIRIRRIAPKRILYDQLAESFSIRAIYLACRCFFQEFFQTPMDKFNFIMFFKHVLFIYSILQRPFSWSNARLFKAQ